MPALTITDLNNATTDLGHIAEVATSLAATATDRLGHVKQTMSAASNAVALTAAGQATTARIAAEAARDAALLGQNAGVIGKDTQANLYADLAYVAGTIGWVTNDGATANNGTYRKLGATGLGSWVQSSFDRVTLLETRTGGVGSTYETLVGNGVATVAYLQRKNADDILKRTDWQGTNNLSATARTNKIPRSSEMNLWTLAAGVVVTPNAALAPDGTMTADLIDLTAAAPSAGLYNMVATGVVGLVDTNWIWLRGAVGGEIIAFKDVGTAAGGNITLTTAWQQFALPVTHGAVQMGPWLQKDTGNQIYAWGGEVKDGSAFSPYIPTAAAPVTVTDYALESNNKVTLAVAPAVGNIVRWGALAPQTVTAQILGDSIVASAAKTAPVDADMLGLSDSAAGNLLKKLSWANLKAAIKSYLDSFYIKTNQLGILSSDIFQIDDTKTRVIVGTTTGSGGTGANLTAMGYGVLVANTSGYDNTAMGALALRYSLTGGGCTAVGNQAGFSTDIAFYLTAFGDAALRNSTGERNHAFGAYAGNGVTTGQDNLFLGWSAGRRQTTISNTLIIDHWWRATPADELSNGLIVGHFDASPALQWLQVNGKLKPAYGIEMPAGAKFNNVAQPTGTPVAATDLATALTLINSLRAALLTLGLVA